MQHTLDRVWSPADVAILEFADLRWAFPGAQATAIRERFNLSTVEYFSRLEWVLHQPQAEAWNGQLVNRLRRLRENRGAARSARRLTGAAPLPLPSPLNSAGPTARRYPSDAGFVMAALLTDTRAACRPRGVIHLYDGPLTPTGATRHGHRPVCGIPTRRMRTLEVTPLVVELTERRRRVCRSCSARLASQTTWRAEHTPRATVLAAVARQPRWVLAALARLGSPAWADPYDVQVAALVHDLLGPAPVEWPDGFTPRPLTFAPRPVRDDLTEDEWAARLDELDEAEKAIRRAAWAEREAQIDRIGISNARPTPRRTRAS